MSELCAEPLLLLPSYPVPGHCRPLALADMMLSWCHTDTQTQSRYLLVSFALQHADPSSCAHLAPCMIRASSGSQTQVIIT